MRYYFLMLLSVAVIVPGLAFAQDSMSTQTPMGNSALESKHAAHEAREDRLERQRKARAAAHRKHRRHHRHHTVTTTPK